MRLVAIIAAVLTGTVTAFASDDIAADFKKADHQLNATYKAVEERLSDDHPAKSRLVHAQHAWIAFRDAECTFQSSGEDGGSVAPTIVALCQTALTEDRTTQLKAYLNCEEGDLSCPVPSE